MQTSKQMKLLIGVSLIVFTLGLSLIYRSRVNAAPATFTVTNANDSGSGSLRAVLTAANSNNNPNDMDIINFNIPGSEVHTIAPLSALPAITEKATINGYSQPGAVANTAVSPNPFNGIIKIEISGQNIEGDGAPSGQASGLGVLAEDSIVKGLSIFDFSGVTDDVAFYNANLALIAEGSKAQGNYLGVRADGMTRGPGKNYTTLFVGGTDAEVGGSNPADRNIISNRESPKIAAAAIMSQAQGVIIRGNYIGMAKDGVTDLTPEPADATGFTVPLTIGINIIGAVDNNGNSTIGGSVTGQANLISGAEGNLVLSSSDNIVQGNYVGTDYTGSVNAGITNGAGVINSVTSGNLVGGTQAGQGNTIAGVAGAGVLIGSVSNNGTELFSPDKLSVLGNTIKDIKIYDYAAFGDSNLGIDLISMIDESNPPNYEPDIFTDQGPNPNDAGDSDGGANHYMNYPVLKTAKQVGNQLTITYDLDASDSPSNTYRVEFFANNASTIFGHGPGETYLGAATSATPGTNKTVTLTVNGDVTNLALSATNTAIDNTTSSGFGSTSEFARNISIGSSTDFDSDGAPDAVENAAPNNGDGNNDGTPDMNQPTITSYVLSGTSVYATLLTSGCSENGTVASVDVSSLNTYDNGYEYPYGLTDFTLNCSRGDTVNVTMYIHSDQDATKYMPRKFNKVSKTFSDIPGSSLTKEVLATSTVMKLAYSVTDGGSLDDDGMANGIIVDPVGLASEKGGVLANTGLLIGLTVPVGLLMIGVTLYTYVDYRKHKKPLVESDRLLNQNFAKSYTYWHHLRVVSIPLIHYRILVTFEKKERAAVLGN